MSDEPQVPDSKAQETDAPATITEESTSDTLHRTAKEQAETHSEKRKKHRERILGSLSQEEDTNGKSPEEIYQNQIKESYGSIDKKKSDFWKDIRFNLKDTWDHEATKPTRVTDNGTKIYVFDQSPSISSLVASNSDAQEVYQMIQLPPVDGKVKIVGLLYTPHGFEMAEIDADSEEFENEGALWAFIDQDDVDSKDNSRHNAPILKYFDELSAQLHDPDQSLPFFVDPKNIKILNENCFSYLSQHPDSLTGPLPEFDKIKAVRPAIILPQGNNPESIYIRELHYMLAGLADDITFTLEMAAANKPDSTYDNKSADYTPDNRIKFFGGYYERIEIHGIDENGYGFLVSWSDQQNQYAIYKKRPDNSDIEDFIHIDAPPGRPFHGSVGGQSSSGSGSGPVRIEHKTLISEYLTFLNNIRKTLSKEAEANVT